MLNKPTLPSRSLSPCPRLPRSRCETGQRQANYDFIAVDHRHEPGVFHVDVDVAVCGDIITQALRPLAIVICVVVTIAWCLLSRRCRAQERWLRAHVRLKSLERRRPPGRAAAPSASTSRVTASPWGWLYLAVSHPSSSRRLLLKRDNDHVLLTTTRILERSS